MQKLSPEAASAKKKRDLEYAKSPKRRLRKNKNVKKPANHIPDNNAASQNSTGSKNGNIIGDNRWSSKSIARGFPNATCGFHKGNSPFRTESRASTIFGHIAWYIPILFPVVPKSVDFSWDKKSSDTGTMKL